WMVVEISEHTRFDLVNFVLPDQGLEILYLVEIVAIRAWSRLTGLERRRQRGQTSRSTFGRLRSSSFLENCVEIFPGSNILGIDLQGFSKRGRRANRVSFMIQR